MAKTIKTGVLYRTADLERSTINAEGRTVELSFSSAYPVLRDFGYEILDHSPDAINMGRLNGGGPLLMDHNTRDQIGVIVPGTARTDGTKGRAMVRFSKSARGQEIFQDVQDGIRSQISVGYRAEMMLPMEEDDPLLDAEMCKAMAENGASAYRVTRWQPMEVSIVSVPADPSVGIGREDKETNFETAIAERTASVQQTQENKMSNNASPAPAPAPSAGLEDGRNQGMVAERERITEIQAIADNIKEKLPKAQEMASRAIREGKTLDQFRQEVIAHMPTMNPIQPAAPLEFKPRDWANYSLTRAICGLMDNKGLSGFEREVSDEVSIKRGMKPSGFWVPPEAFTANMSRSLVAGTGTLGGMIVQTSNLGDQFIELLRNRAQCIRLGARVLTLDNPVTIPRQNAAGVANWVAETTAGTLSVGNFTQITLTPNGLSAIQQYSKQLLATNNPSIDGLVRDDILNIIALAIDLAALHGTGSGQPTGIAGTTGIGTVTLAANAQALGNSTAYPALVSLESAVATANADVGSLAYLMRASHRGSLRTTTRFASTNTPVFEGPGPNSVDGMVNGYRAAVTNQIATNLTTGTATTITSAIFFGNWNDLLIGQFNGGATDLVVDPYTLASNAVVRLVARHWIDIGVRHPASFAVLGGIL